MDFLRCLNLKEEEALHLLKDPDCADCGLVIPRLESLLMTTFWSSKSKHNQLSRVVQKPLLEISIWRAPPSCRPWPQERPVRKLSTFESISEDFLPSLCVFYLCHLRRDFRWDIEVDRILMESRSTRLDSDGIETLMFVFLL